jgi:hypothetical protein
MTTNLTIAGGNSTQSGIVPVPSNLPTSFNTTLQSYLNTLSTSIAGGDITFINNNIAGTSVYSITGSSSVGGVEELTNTDSTGAVSPGSVSGAFTTNGGVSTLIVQAPGDETVTGNGNTSVATFGVDSNVDYSDENGGTSAAPDSVFAAGGANQITLYSTTNTGSAYNVYSAGDDTVNLLNQGVDSVMATGTANTKVVVSQANATISATQGSTVSIVFTEGAGGNIDFINDSSAAQTIFSGSYTTAGGASVYAPNAVTAYGGAGGGYYVGGRSGNNSLVGGTGIVSLQGAGTGDVLIANGYSASNPNQLYAGTGLETLLGSASTGANTFQLGLNYTGIGAVTASGIASTDGSGTQSFLLGNANGETLTGSNAAGAFNIYSFVGDSTTGGGSFTITDFTSTNSALYLVGASDSGASDAAVSVIGSNLQGNAQILLTDGTTITLKGVAASVVAHTVLGSGSTAIYIK